MGVRVDHVLVDTVEVLVGKAQEMRRRPGHKTDKADARWMAELWAHGLIRPSVIPAAPDPGSAGFDADTRGLDPGPDAGEKPGRQGVTFHIRWRGFCHIMWRQGIVKLSRSLNSLGRSPRLHP